MPPETIRRGLSTLSLTLLMCCPQQASAQGDCPEVGTTASERAFVRPGNWADIHRSFQQFRHCDDGALAKSYSDLVVRTLASRCDLLGELVGLARSDSTFHAFVLRHIDATTGAEDVRNRRQCHDPVPAATRDALCGTRHGSPAGVT